MEQVTTMSESFIFEPLTLYTSDSCGNNCLNLNNYYENLGAFHSIESAAPCMQTAAVSKLMGEKEGINWLILWTLCETACQNLIILFSNPNN